MASKIMAKSINKPLTNKNKSVHNYFGLRTSYFGQGHNYSLKTKYNFSHFARKRLFLHLKNKFPFSRPPPLIKNKNVHSVFVLR